MTTYIAWLPINHFQCPRSSFGVTLCWRQQGSVCHQSVWCHASACRPGAWHAAAVLAVPRWMGPQQMPPRHETHKYWAACSTQLESGTVTAVPGSSDRREKSRCLGKQLPFFWLFATRCWWWINERGCKHASEFVAGLHPLQTCFCLNWGTAVTAASRRCSCRSHHPAPCLWVMGIAGRVTVLAGRSALQSVYCSLP